MSLTYFPITDGFTARRFYQPATRLAGQAFEWDGCLYFEKELAAQIAGYPSFASMTELVERTDNVYLIGDVECLSAAFIFTSYVFNSGKIPGWVMSHLWPGYEAALRSCIQ